jgi:tRNA-splicing ligase RtcB
VGDDPRFDGHAQPHRHVPGESDGVPFGAAGAGRRYTRTTATKLFTMRDLETAMAGIEFRHSSVLLDEIPFAYKDIDEVIENAKSLVEVRYTLRQFVNIKGD